MNKEALNNRTRQDFAEALRERMQVQGISFPGLAKEIDFKLSATYIHNLASGKAKPTKDNIEVLAKGLDTDPSYFKEYREYKAKDKINTDPEIADFILDETAAEIPSEFAKLTAEQKKAAVEFIKELQHTYRI
ncbi:MAG TPA: helix-turn-helix transcriptional regulator [Candidatus Aquicultor sp.]|jgi:transcriptional regulator with XRE-family HTH domain